LSGQFTILLSPSNKLFQECAGLRNSKKWGIFYFKNEMNDFKRRREILK
jgi:hypothetical protein